MDSMLAVAAGVSFAVAVYLLLSPSLTRVLCGAACLGNAAGLALFALARPVPPGDGARLADPLAVTLIFVAIPLAIAMLGVLAALARRAQEAGEDGCDDDGGQARQRSGAGTTGQRHRGTGRAGTP